MNILISNQWPRSVVISRESWLYFASNHTTTGVYLRSTDRLSINHRQHSIVTRLRMSGYIVHVLIYRRINFQSSSRVQTSTGITQEMTSSRMHRFDWVAPMHVVGTEETQMWFDNHVGTFWCGNIHIHIYRYVEWREMIWIYIRIFNGVIDVHSWSSCTGIFLRLSLFVHWSMMILLLPTSNKMTGTIWRCSSSI